MLEKFITDLTKDEATKIESLMAAKEAPAGKVLIEQGSEGRSLFFLISGEYEIYQKLEISFAFHAIKIATLTGPTLFGEASLLSKQERNATVLVKKDCKYLELSEEAFETLKEKHPELALKLVIYAGATVVQRYNGLNNRLQKKMFAKAEDLQRGLLWVQKYMGEVQKCSPEVAKKLFKI